jgi:hypothetical protein
MSKKYCITQLSLDELRQAEEIYNWFTYEHISSFERNNEAYEQLQNNKIDVIYIYSQLIKKEEFWGIYTWNIYISEKWIYLIDTKKNTTRIPNQSTLYILRIGKMSVWFRTFLTLYAKKQFNIEVVLPTENKDITTLSSKCHSLAFEGNMLPPCIVPYIINKGDIEHLVDFLLINRSLFWEKIIAKKAWFWSGEWVKVIEMRDIWVELKRFLSDDYAKDFIIMKHLSVTDIELRVLWMKDTNWKVIILEIFGKKRLEGNILHNIAQWNELIHIGTEGISKTLSDSIAAFCNSLPEKHWWLDVLEWVDGAYYITENNTMTWYLSEEAQKFFCKDWLDAVASCYK